jgi:hypothetical protein
VGVAAGCDAGAVVFSLLVLYGLSPSIDWTPEPIWLYVIERPMRSAPIVLELTAGALVVGEPMRHAPHHSPFPVLIVHAEETDLGTAEREDANAVA